MSSLRVTAVFYISILFSLLALPPIYACGHCNPPYQARPTPPISTNPPNHGRGSSPPRFSPPSTNPPVFGRPPVVRNPPLEAAVCLCTSIRLKLLNLNIFIPLALQVLVTCGKNPPPGFICPPL
ncbi:hypothetical protein MKW94_019664 [Papaver nudicaule]|uniref:Hydrophobic seed protein domain-containing protein n=1 Tax=Papaver nudicaule TaxID=74823 RepID=A0AA42AZD8_PAPNU|nr:hypothetical protein [Papaver nudicaule]